MQDIIASAWPICCYESAVSVTGNSGILMMIKLYHVPASRSMRSLWLLNELALDYELIEMTFDLEHLRSPEYLAVHPLGRVPTLVDDGRIIYESGAICQYLCEKYDDGSLHRAPGHPERVEWLQWLHYAETLAVHSAALLQQQVFIAPDERSPAIQQLESRRLGKGIELLDEHLQGCNYLLASGFSAVDVNVGYSVYLGGGFISLEPYPNIFKYYQRIRERLAFKKSEPSVDWQLNTKPS
ncbi:MAG: glutathione S-transferase family protein [Pseudomonadales bacterium]